MTAECQIALEESTANASFGSKYPTFDWSLNIVTREFCYDFDALKALLNLHEPIVTVTDFMGFITLKQRKELEAVFRQAMKSKEGQYFNCCFIPNRSITAYVEFYLELVEPDLLKGTVRPLMIIPSKLQVANVFRDLFENSHHGVVITDHETRIVACNQYYEQQMGYERGALIGAKTNIFNSGKHSDELYQDMWHRLHTVGFWSGTLLTRDSHNSISPQELTIQKIEPKLGEIYYLGLTVSLSKQLTRIAASELGGITLATKLPNKDKFLSDVRQLCHKEEKQHGKMVLIIKPDFPSDSHNDQFEFAEVLSLATLNQAIGYLGDGMFAVCIDCETCLDGIQSRHVRSVLRDFFQELKSVCRKEIYDSVMLGKIGVSILGLDSKNACQLLSHATQAMLERHAGEDKNISFYHGAIHNEIKRKKRLEVAVQAAIEQRLLAVYYQPIINTNSGEIEKLEALCRFPTITEPSTVQELIYIAEDLELITELDSQISILALDQLDEIQRVFGRHVGLTLNCSLNTKRGSIAVLKNLIDLISLHATKPEYITIELTESAYFDNDANQSDSLDLLRNLGVSIAIDDFGTGYSSFSYLSDSQFDVLKVDKAFITDIHLESNKYNIVKMITELSHTLGVKVVAEGVENYHEFKVLQKLQVDNVQGYLFSRPKAFSEFESGKPYVEQLESAGLVLKSGEAERLLRLSQNGPPRIHPSEPLSLAYQYINDQHIQYIPVVLDNKCVGIISREAINLHLTLTMGTDLETTKEAQVWKRTVNQVMKVSFTQLLNTCSVNELPELLNSGVPFPWVFIDKNGDYSGMIFESDILKYLIPQ